VARSIRAFLGRTLQISKGGPQAYHIYCHASSRKPLVEAWEEEKWIPDRRALYWTPERTYWRKRLFRDRVKSSEMREFILSFPLKDVSPVCPAGVGKLGVDSIRKVGSLGSFSFLMILVNLTPREGAISSI